MYIFFDRIYKVWVIIMEWYHIVLLVILGINLLILILFPFILSFLLYQIQKV